MAATDPSRGMVNNPYNQTEFADHVVTVLTESNDGQMAARVGRSLTQSGGASPERARLAERLLNRASALGVTLPPAEPRGTQAMDQSPATPGVMRIRVGSAVQDTKVTKRVAPEYPALAREARIQGTVRFDVVIGADGAISSMTLVSGHPLLVLPAQAALRNWIYQPTLLNGKPVEVQTTVDVNFLLSQ